MVHPLHTSKGIGLWVVESNYNVVLAQTSNGKKTLGGVKTDAQGSASGYLPVMVKVDGSQNVWVANEVNATKVGGVLQEYNKNGALQAAYAWNACGPQYSVCYQEGFDGSATPSYVFAEVSLWQGCYSGYGYHCYSYQQGSGFEYWSAGDPSANPTFIPLTFGAPVEEVYYMDVDASDNIWFDYYGYDSGTGLYGYGLGEITNATTNPQFVSILPVGSIGFPGGVYVSGKASAQVLNVTDQLSLEIYQYHLPLSPSGSPFNTLGPTYYFGDPVSGGFNKTEANNVQADCPSNFNAWVDIGLVSTNKWKPVKTFADESCLTGAAYTPSDR